LLSLFLRIAALRQPIRRGLQRRPHISIKLLELWRSGLKTARKDIPNDSLPESLENIPVTFRDARFPNLSPPPQSQSH